MNDSEWLRTRRPTPPSKLSARVQVAVGQASEESTTSRSERLASAAAAILAPLLQPDAGDVPRSRDVAIDLLAADALVTYAIESAAEDRGAMGQNIDSVVAYLAALAPEGKV